MAKALVSTVLGASGTYDALMKEMYKQKKIENMIYANNPFLGMVPKNENFKGDNLVVPIHYGHTNKRSAGLDVAASTLAGTAKTAKFVVERAKDYAVADLSREAILASDGNDAAFLKYFQFNVDDAIIACKRSAAQGVYGSGTGTVGVVGTLTVTNTVITLDDLETVTNFEVGQSIGLSATDGGAILSSAYVSILSIDRDLGTLTFAADITGTIAAAAATNFISFQGDLNLKMKGLAGWLPSTAPTAGDDFWGVDRSVDATRLGGVRFDATSSSAALEEVLMDVAGRLGREGASPDHVFLSFAKWQDLAQSLQAQKRYSGGSSSAAKGDISYSNICLAGPNGEIKVVADHNCPGDKVYMLELNSWELASLGPATSVFSNDGQMIRNTDSDSYEVRIGGYGNLVCHAPGRNAVISF